MRLIDADTLIEEVIMHEEQFDYVDDILGAVGAAPTIDPVKHEHWIRKKMLNHVFGTWKTLCMCSGYRHTQLTESAFCGGCGAKMDGDSNE